MQALPLGLPARATARQASAEEGVRIAPRRPGATAPLARGFQARRLEQPTRQAPPEAPMMHTPDGPMRRASGSRAVRPGRAAGFEHHSSDCNEENP
ncbi:hypothetical protein GmRootA79_50240 [Acidovorax sp. A79]